MKNSYPEKTQNQISFFFDEYTDIGLESETVQCIIDNQDIICCEDRVLDLNMSNISYPERVLSWFKSVRNLHTTHFKRVFAMNLNTNLEVQNLHLTISDDQMDMYAIQSLKKR